MAHKSTWKPKWQTINEVNRIAKTAFLLLKYFPLGRGKPF